MREDGDVECGLDVNGNGINVFKLNGIVRRVLLCSDPIRE